MQLKDSSPRKSSRSETWNEPKKWRTHRGNAGKLKPRLCQRLPGRPSRHVIEWNDVANVKAGRLSGAQEFTLAKLYLHLSRKKKRKKKSEQVWSHLEASVMAGLIMSNCSVLMTSKWRVARHQRLLLSPNLIFFAKMWQHFWDKAS